MATVSSVRRRAASISADWAKREADPWDQAGRPPRQHRRRAAASPPVPPPPGINPTPVSTSPKRSPRKAGGAQRAGTLRAPARVIPNGATPTGRGQTLSSRSFADTRGWRGRPRPSRPPAQPAATPQVGAHAEVPRSPVTTKAAKSRTASEAGLRTDAINETTSPPMAFLSECSSMQPTPSPRSTSEAPALARTTPFERRKPATRA